MTREEMIDFLVETYNEDREELEEMDNISLEERFEEYEDDSTMYPNGRDYDSEDWE